MALEHSTAGELNTVEWEGVQGVVREFRRALDRGERPALEAYLPEHGTQRKDALIELVHEEMEFRIKAGESSVLGSYLERFPEIVDDPRALASWSRPSWTCGGGWRARPSMGRAAPWRRPKPRRGRRSAWAVTSWEK